MGCYSVVYQQRGRKASLPDRFWPMAQAAVHVNRQRVEQSEVNEARDDRTHDTRCRKTFSRLPSLRHNARKKHRDNQ
jgi:hypothetical protein